MNEQTDFELKEKVKRFERPLLYRSEEVHTLAEVAYFRMVSKYWHDTTTIELNEQYVLYLRAYREKAIRECIDTGVRSFVTLENVPHPVRTDHFAHLWSFQSMLEMEFPSVHFQVHDGPDRTAIVYFSFDGIQEAMGCGVSC